MEKIATFVHWRNELARVLCNFILRHIATPRYGQFIQASIQYGMDSAARDEVEGNPPPPQWREYYGKF
jgi:hypothetical protein